jgi:predicted nucleic acid-binding protein
MSFYVDSSFLVSCHLSAANTPQAKAYLSKINSALIFTALQALEVRNAFHLCVFRGFLSTNKATAARVSLEQDLHSGRLLKMTVHWPLAFRIASQISTRHSAIVGTRSLDILHVAAAKSLRALEFVSFDGRQRKVAAAVGLKVAP